MPESQPTENNQPTFQVRGQYVKDLSFENPNAPQSLMAGAIQPNIDMGVDLKAQKLQDDVYEVIMHISARASAEGNSIFLIEVAYAGIFQITNIPPEHLERVLMIDCPFVLFPFVRRVISDVTRDGGFLPLMLDPIDFHQLYLQNAQRAEAPVGV